MGKRIRILCAVFLPMFAWAYSTPDTGVSWTMDELVANSGGDVTGAAPNYQLHDDVFVMDADTLTIAAGTTITRDDGGTWPHLVIIGKLLAQGTEASPILITSAVGRGVSADLDRSLEFHSTASSNSVLNHIIVEHSDFGVFVSAASGLIFSNCTARRCNEGFYLSSTDTVLEGCLSEDHSTNGVFVYSGSPRINNCTVQNSKQGIYLYQSDATIFGGAVHDNGEIRGAGIYAYKGSPTIENCYIYGNETTTASGDDYGGGVAFIEVVDARISGCEFSHNRAQFGGGLFVKDSLNVLIERVYFLGGNGEIDSNLDHNGAAMQAESSSGIVADGCRIRNQAFFWQTDGQVINNALQGFGTTDSSPLIAHNVITGYKLYFFGNSDPLVANNIFTAGTYVHELDANADPQIQNNIFEPDLRAEGILDDENGTWIASISALNAIAGNSGNVETNSGFNLPFYLSEFAMTGWSISSNAPAIDSALDMGIEVDFRGVFRPLDGNADSNAMFDIGPVEYASFSIDTDNDGISDGDEVANKLDPLVSNTGVDSDTDGLLDGDEVNTHGTNPLDADSDDDGLSDEEEINTHGTNPLNSDSDADGLSDGAEVNTHATDPLDTDSDDDGISDGNEVNLHGTNPLSSDTDGDGISDDAELNAGLDPLISNIGMDSDSDGLLDIDEVNTHGTNPLDADSDDDGLSDGDEVNTQGTNPLNSDSDADGLSDGDEVNTHATDPLDTDSDDDGISDGNEVNLHGTNPLSSDTDSDGISDDAELNAGLDPLISNIGMDSDSDGLLDIDEVNTHGTNPLNADTDGDEMDDLAEMENGLNPLVSNAGVDSDSDGLSDAEEVNTHSTNPLVADSDNDGLSDGAEVNTHSTDPNNPDSDGDTVLDGVEIQFGLDPNNPADAAADGDGDGITSIDEIANKVIVWGDTNAPVNVPAGVIAPKAIATGVKHALALLKDGSVKAWGDNAAGQCNVPELQTNAVAIATGAEHSLALLANGRVAQWGWGDQNWPIQMSELRFNSSSYYWAYLNYDLDSLIGKPLQDGPESAYGFFVNNNSDEIITEMLIPLGIRHGVFFADEAYNNGFTAVIFEDRTVFSAGNVLPDDDASFYVVTTNLEDIATGGEYYGYFNGARRGLYSIKTASGSEFENKEFWGPSGYLHGSVSIAGATVIAVGDYHSLAILTNGTVTAWGTNDFGQCDVPATATNAISISANRRFSSAVLQDGSVVVWGGE